MIDVKKIGGAILLVVMSVSFAMPGIVAADIGGIDAALNTQSPDGGVGSEEPAASKFQLVSCQGIDDPRTTDVKEVECDFNQLIATFNRIIKFVLWLVTPIVVGMMVFTGFKYITAGGDMNLIADAKRMFTPIIIGMFFIFAGWLLVYTVLDELLDTQVSGRGDASDPGIKKTDILPARIGS